MRLAGDTARAGTTDEVKVLRRERRDLKEVVAEQALELRPDRRAITLPARRTLEPTSTDGMVVS